MIKRSTLLRWLTLVCIIIASVTGTVFAEELPFTTSKTIYIHDYATVLDYEAKQQMQSHSESLVGKTGSQLIVVTVNTTGGIPIEQYSLDLFRKWGIGDKEKNNGVLLLVAVKDRKSRIEVGYGLEGVLNDAKTDAIQDNYMIPSFRNEDYNYGIWLGYGAIFGEILKEYQIESKSWNAARIEPKTEEFEWTWENIMLFIGIFIFVCIDMKLTGGRIPVSYW